MGQPVWSIIYVDGVTYCPLTFKWSFRFDFATYIRFVSKRWTKSKYTGSRCIIFFEWSSHKRFIIPG